LGLFLGEGKRIAQNEMDIGLDDTPTCETHALVKSASFAGEKVGMKGLLLILEVICRRFEFMRESGY
jgi:hypothetical protein